MKLVEQILEVFLLFGSLEKPKIEPHYFHLYEFKNFPHKINCFYFSYSYKLLREGLMGVLIPGPDTHDADTWQQLDMLEYLAST